ncbi:MAG: hypothetical protein SF066_04565 [Thermoanaerobaculia bacterium]|nr:hypothetical protein [Thermoanaerobaculia bacterium]
MKIARATLCCLSWLATSVPAPATDLTAAFGTPQLVADLIPGAPSSFPDLLPVAGGWLVLTHAVPEQVQLWRTDGTPGGTSSLQPPGVVFHRVLPTAGPLHWLVARDPGGKQTLWRTDGTTAGTLPLVDDLLVGDPMGFDAPTGLLFFNASFESGAAFDDEPWVSDGTPAGTHLLKDLLPGPDNASAAELVRLGDRLYFRGLSPEGRFVLWTTDGTPAGTRVAVSAPDGEYQGLWQAGTALYLLELHQLRLWRSDGTAAGTVLLEDFGPAGESSGTIRFVGDLGGGKTAWFVVRLDGSAALWASDGTPGGAQRLVNLLRVLSPQSLRLGGRSYLLADEGVHGVELWTTDGTPAGTRLVVDFCPGRCDGFVVEGLVPVGGDRLLLRTPGNGSEPVVSDGTAAGTFLLGDLCPGPCSSSVLPEFALDLGGAVLFAATSGTGNRQLWATDLTPEGTVQLTRFTGAVNLLAADAEEVFVQADDGATGAELWRIPRGRLDPLPPAGPWHTSAALPGFEAKVRIAGPGGEGIPGRPEIGCIAETLCFSGAVPRRTELFVRVVGPKPNGRLWPTLVKFTTSAAEIWIRQASSGEVRFYQLPAARPGVDELAGLFDREGFVP